MNQFQEYFVREFVEEYRIGHMSRRDMMRRVLFITGGVASTATLLASLGVPTAALAQPEVLAEAPADASPLSVPPDDPSVSANWISFPNQQDGATIMAYEARPADASGPLPVMLVCHRNQGVEPQIQDVARRWAKLGYIAAAVDLLSREGGTNGVADKAQIPAMLSNTDANRHVSDFVAAADYYSGSSDADASRLGMNGFCFGGGITWRTAEALPSMKAAAPFYGAPPPLDQVPNIGAAVLGVYSADPNDFANNNRDGLDAALSQAGVTHQMNVYPGTKHDFYNDTGQAYNEQQALTAWHDAVNWMQMYL
ncbi:MAG: dienelactone hydrolase family protein [Chloroflexi bacterium]|nr:dienelactone hydrolase family protein [Chloroflexota bacterium]MBV9547719.1 dienelactone hydrolase family protein [Chloroflexota bacterium]